MQLGIVGLGRMGGNIARRLMRHGHECVVYDRARDAVEGLIGEGAKGASAMTDLVGLLEAAARRLADAAGGTGHRERGRGVRGAARARATS